MSSSSQLNDKINQIADNVIDILNIIGDTTEDTSFTWTDDHGDKIKFTTKTSESTPNSEAKAKTNKKIRVDCGNTKIILEVEDEN